MTLVSATLTLVFVMDPLGNIPIFLAALNPVAPQKRQWVILRESLIAFVILLLFLLFGQYILEAMHISQPALSISGGIILFLIAIRMIFPEHDEGEKPKKNIEPFIVPLAVPLIAGPSTMTMTMVMANQGMNDTFLLVVALSTAWFLTTAVLVFSVSLRKVLGERGLIAIERLMGMILTTMAVQMFLTGFEQILHS